MRMTVLLSGWLILSFAASGCGGRRSSAALPPSFLRQEIITEIRDFQRALGFQDTENFLRYAGIFRAFYRWESQSQNVD